MQYSCVVDQCVHPTVRLVDVPKRCIDRRRIPEVHMYRFDVEFGAAKRCSSNLAGPQVTRPEQDRIPNFGELASDRETYSTICTCNENCSFSYENPTRFSSMAAEAP